MSGATPVIVAYVSGQLLIAHEAIASIWNARKSGAEALEAAIFEAVKCLPEEHRDGDMPKAEDGKNSSDAISRFTSKENNPKRKREERNRNNDGLI